MEHPPAALDRQPRVERLDVLRRRLFAVSLTGCVTIVVLMAGPSLLGLFHVADDLCAYHLPLRYFYQSCLHNGHAFDWWPALFCGYYVTGEGQAGAYHPLHLLLYKTLPLHAAFELELLLSYPFMLVGTFLFLQRVVRRNEAAMFGALLFTFGGFNMLRFVHPNGVAVIAHIPWLLWSADIILTSPTAWRRTFAQLGVALIFGSQLLLGYPQYVWFGLLMLGGWTLFRLTAPPSRLDMTTDVLRRVSSETGSNVTARIAPNLRTRLARVGLLVVAGFVGLLLGCVQLLPTIDALQTSVRTAADKSFYELGSIHPANLLQLVGPYALQHRVWGINTHETSLYFGAAPLLLIAWMYSRRRHWSRNEARLMLLTASLAALFLFLSFGSFSPLYPIQRMIPLVNSFRCPCRHVVLAQLALATMAAVAFRHLLRTRFRRPPDASRLSKSERIALALPVAAAILVGVGGAIFGAASRFASPASCFAGVAIFATAACAMWGCATGRRWAVTAFIVIALFDLGTYGLSYAILDKTAPWQEIAERYEHPPADGGESSVRGARSWPRVVGDQFTGNAMTIFGYRRADGYAGLVPECNHDERDLASLQRAGVGWVKRPATVSREATDGDAEDGKLPEWLRIPKPLPFVRIVMPPPADDSTDRVVDQPTSGGATIVDESPGRIDLRVDVDRASRVFVAESFHDGWRAWRGEQAIELQRLEGDFLGFDVAEGKSDIRLEFQPTSLRWGRWVSFAGLALSSVYVVAGVIAVARTATPTSPAR